MDLPDSKRNQINKKKNKIVQFIKFPQLNLRTLNQNVKFRRAILKIMKHPRIKNPTGGPVYHRITICN